MTAYDLARFVAAQDPIYDQVCVELAAGSKRTHWMWFIFPQIAGLGVSATSRFYALGSRAEAEAFLAHPKLGTRLRTCTRLVLGVEGRTARQIFGSPDDIKFRSSMTLFAQVAESDGIFREALTRYFAGEPDPQTLQQLERNTPAG